MWFGPDEPYSCFAVEPYHHLNFKKGQKSATVEITNLSLTSQLYKVKSTDNNLFEIDPVMGILDVNEMETINIKFLGKEAPTRKHEDEEGVHYVSILNNTVGENVDDPEKAWEEAKKKNPPYEGNHSMIVQFPDWHPKSEEEWSIGTDEEEETGEDTCSSDYDTFETASDAEYSQSSANTEHIDPFSDTSYKSSKKGSKKSKKGSKKSKKGSEKSKMDSKKSGMGSKKSGMGMTGSKKSKKSSKKSKKDSKKP